MRRTILIAAIAAAAFVAGLLVMGGIRIGGLFGEGPDPETIAAASLQSVREQSKLTPFVARFVSVVTSRQSRFGLTAEKTLIMPGTVRYEIDLAKLGAGDLRWSEADKTLSVRLPPIELAGPEIDLAATQEYSDGRVLMALSNAEDRLDQANRQRGQQNLLAQAKAPAPMRMARNAARVAVERSFAMPLKAAGVDARVVARFADEAGSQDPSFLDRSRSIEDVLKERQGAK